jgi:hypothetical protein
VREFPAALSSEYNKAKVGKHGDAEQNGVWF